MPQVGAPDFTPYKAFFKIVQNAKNLRNRKERISRKTCMPQIIELGSAKAKALEEVTFLERNIARKTWVVRAFKVPRLKKLSHKK